MRLTLYEHPFDNCIIKALTKSNAVNCMPGALVQHADWPTSFGLLLANTDDALLVLWSREPGILPRYDPLAISEDIYVPVRKT